MQVVRWYDCGMHKELQDLGLSEKEARVYLAALEIGRATADQLAKHSKIVRPTTYVQLESLMKKGLMSTYEEGKKTYFAPESPELLRRLLIKQKEELNTKEGELSSILPALLQQFESAGERPVVRFFPGKEGVAAAREEVFSTRNKKIYIIFSPEKLSHVFSQQYLDEYSDKRRALGIHSRGIFTYKEYFAQAGDDGLTERRFLPPSELPLTVDIFIFDDKVAVHSLEGAMFGLVIQSAQIAKSTKFIFDFLWRYAHVANEK
jgi:HTH-type transcriptional regulator, sugar sensing transcriptional regulator